MTGPEVTQPDPDGGVEMTDGEWAAFRGVEVTAAMQAEAVECPLSERVDGKKHSWKWASDGPYVECHYCGELQDAMNGTVITPGRKS